MPCIASIVKEGVESIQRSIYEEGDASMEAEIRIYTDEKRWCDEDVAVPYHLLLLGSPYVYNTWCSIRHVCL